MIRYSYTAYDGKGKWQTGTVKAINEEDARRFLKTRGLEAAQIAPYRLWYANGLRSKLALLRTPDLSHLALATRQLSVMLNAGLDVVRSLDVLQSADYGDRLNLAWADISRSLQRGLPLSKAMGRHPTVFSPVFRGLVKAGENSGALVANLNAMADNLERDLALRQRLRAALVYPAFVFLVCILSVLVLTQKVLPSLIQGVFKESGTELPWMTRSVIWVGDALNAPWFYHLVIPGCFFLLVFFGNYLRTRGGRYRLQWMLRRLPVARGLVVSTSAARFCRTMSSLSACGIPLVHSLELTDMVLDDYVMSRAIDQVVVGVENGESLTELIRQSEAFPPVVAGFAELGEETGHMASAFRHLAQLLEEEIELSLNSLMSALEPLMIGLMGAIVGYVVVAMFLPLYTMLNGAT